MKTLSDYTYSHLDVNVYACSGVSVCSVARALPD